MKDRSDDPLHHERTLLPLAPFVRGAMGRRMVDPLSYFSFQPVLHDLCNKGRGICYPVYGMVHIKETLLLIEKQLALNVHVKHSDLT